MCAWVFQILSVYLALRRVKWQAWNWSKTERHLGKSEERVAFPEGGNKLMWVTENCRTIVFCMKVLKVSHNTWQTGILTLIYWSLFLSSTVKIMDNMQATFLILHLIYCRSSMVIVDVWIMNNLTLCFILLSLKWTVDENIWN